MEELQSKYTRQSKAYNQLVEETIAKPESVSTNVKKITDLAAEMGKTLDEMLTLIVQDTNATQTQRDELIQKLTKIQKDYNGLINDKDKLETLRRIREFEDTHWKRTLYMLILIFCVAILFIIGFMLLRKKRVDTTSIAPVPEIPGV